MARPRVFISSTYFDLKQVRADLERFIHELGYTSVLSERGQIAYGSGQRLEEYCYKEVSQVDLLIAVIGGRFGSDSQHAPHSVTQMEIKIAHDQGKQIYVFIDRSVYSEYQTYKVNKSTNGIKYAAVNDPRVYEFIEYIESLRMNNTMHAFEVAEDIVTFLKEQWAGLFQRFLHESSQAKDIRKVEDLQATARTLQEVVQSLLAHREGQTTQLREIALSSHPLLNHVRKLLQVNYRVFFTTKNELADWLKARNMRRALAVDVDDYETWMYDLGHDANKKTYVFRYKTSLFDEDGRLRLMTPDEWKPDLIQRFESIESTSGDDDDIPF